MNSDNGGSGIVSDSMISEKLSGRREEILRRWFDLIVDGYPEETAKFLRTQKDPFDNPVGQSIRDGIEGIFDSLIGTHPASTLNEGENERRVAAAIDRIIRVRAVQDFSASGAVAFVFALKPLIWEVLGQQDGKRLEGYEWPKALALDMKIDRVALMAFDVYMSCREKLYDIKANEARNMTYRLLQRANLIVEKEPEAGERRSGTDIESK